MEDEHPGSRGRVFQIAARVRTRTLLSTIFIRAVGPKSLFIQIHAKMKIGYLHFTGLSKRLMCVITIVFLFYDFITSILLGNLLNIRAFKTDPALIRINI